LRSARVLRDVRRCGIAAGAVFDASSPACLRVTGAHARMTAALTRDLVRRNACVHVCTRRARECLPCPRGTGQMVARRSTVLSAMGSPNPPCGGNRGQGISAVASRWARRTAQARTPLNGRAVVGTGCCVQTLHAVDASDHHPSARGLCPTLTGAGAPGRPLARGHGRGTRPRDAGDRAIRAPIVPPGRHCSAPPRVQPNASGVPGAGLQVWVGPAGSRIGLAGGG
jgi:hypothetical protein